MVPVRRATRGCTVLLGGLLAALLVGGLLAVPAAAVGLACGVGLVVAVVRGRPAGPPVLGPADLVTLVRATLACAVAALVVEDLVGEPARDPARVALVALAGLALALDAVDGRVARATGTSSRFGARFDGEADAFLILVLSVQVAGSLGAWVLAIGAARYAFGAAGWLMPWLREPLPPRHWRKVVAAVQGVVLLVVATGIPPRAASYAAVVVALALLVESFGRDVRWLWWHRPAPRTGGAAAAGGIRLP